ncbi:MAG TPA: amidohydrolase family protein [Vicinamibacterales bacterium]|nr:amidohydrolase family protein [Vicinamibacterales bacterium]
MIRSRSSVVVGLLVAGLVSALLTAAQDPPRGRGAGGQGRGGRGVPTLPNGECPEGMTMTRPGTCQAPQFPPPSIVDYRPRNTLVTAVHEVPKAKFPAIDYHGHVQGRIMSEAGLAALVKDIDEIGLGLMIAADNISGANLQRALDTVKASPHKDRVRVLTGINFSGVGPGWAERAVARLEADIKAGAVGVGEISKSLGLRTRKADGSRLAVDDPDLDPVWEAAARLKIPIFIHTAEPQEFFEPIDFKNERWLELSLFGDRRYPEGRFPRFEELVAERDRMFKKHPNTTFVMAHLGWHGNDLARLGRELDAMPNVYTEVGAVLYDLGRQPRGAREFLTKYQDRVMFGKDAYEPSEYPTYWRVFETTDEYFDYYRDYHAFWKLYGLGLSDAVLKKIYYQNALRITAGLPQSGWPR